MSASIFLIFPLIFHVATADYSVSLQLKSYRVPWGQTDNGQCCDLHALRRCWRLWPRYQKCDLNFKFCVQPFSLGLPEPWNCGRGWLETGVIKKNADRVRFLGKSSYGDWPNPYTFSEDGLWRGLYFHTVVVDMDRHGNESVDTIIPSLTAEDYPAGVPWHIWHLNKRTGASTTIFYFILTVTCLNGSEGVNCTSTTPSTSAATTVTDTTSTSTTTTTSNFTTVTASNLTSITASNLTSITVSNLTTTTASKLTTSSSTTPTRSTTTPVRGDCLEWLESGANQTGIYTICVDDQECVEVYCDMETDGGGWTVFQRRLNGNVDFNRTWTDYSEGFGQLYDEFWLGNRILHRLTKMDRLRGRQELRIELITCNSTRFYQTYSRFSIGSENDSYRLTIEGNSSGTAGDSLSYGCPGSHFCQNGMKFSTLDRDNDNLPVGDCADTYHNGGGWWYNSCGVSNLNGLYSSDCHCVCKPIHDHIYWLTWELHQAKMQPYSFMGTEMKIRPAK